MPIEAALLEGVPAPLAACPKCAARPFCPFLRGMVQRGWLRSVFSAWWSGEKRVRYCALICWNCKEIVGYE